MSETNSIFGRLRQVLQNTYFFQSLKMSELDELIGHLRMIRVQKGYEIIKQGDPGDAFYLIASGKVSVWKKKTMGKTKVADLGPDLFFGEMALMSNEPRNATVVAEEVTELFVLQRYDFEKILMKNPLIASELRKAFMERKSR
ncbi:MAG TPA: cyclic nucleotide-binding domain-containing protein [bacterium]|jgi:CRP-like cAMP-binding protein|nr:cyclic nucleotide-binding domain-containing protein [bacterium]